MNENQPTVRDAKPFFAILLGLILFLFGIAIGYTLSGKTGAAPGGKGYEEGYAAAKAELQTKLIDSGFALPEEDIAALEAQPVTSFGGTISAVNGSTLTVTAYLPSFDPLEPAKEKTYTVRVVDSTSLIRRVEMSPEEADAAFQAFDEAQRAFDAIITDADYEGEFPEPPNPPDPFKEETITLSELTVGLNITVRASEDVKGVSSFDAEEIAFFENSVAEPGPVDIGDLTPPDDFVPSEDEVLP